MSKSSDRLQAIERLIVEAAGSDETIDGAIKAARVEARTILTVGLGPDAEAALAEDVFCASALARLAAAGRLDEDLAHTLAHESTSAEHNLARAMGAIAHPSLTALPLNAAANAQAQLLAHLGSGDAVELWRPDAHGLLAIEAHAGTRTLPRSARSLGSKAWADGGPLMSRHVAAVPVGSQERPLALLIWHGDDSALAAVLVERAAAAIEAPLRVALAVDANVAGFEAAIQQPERRLRRLALDLHDGALQDVALISGELRRLEDDLRPLVMGTDHAEPVRQALESVAGLVAALDADLREVATSVEGPGMLRRPFDEAIETIVRVFRARSPITTALEVEGDATRLSDSQRIAVFRIIQESLTNVHKHSKAKRVVISVRVEPDELIAVIRDDGVGFDAPKAMRSAEARDRIGLLGMVERIRLLGGTCDVDSQPGKGTSVRVHLPSYTPPDNPADDETSAGADQPVTPR